MSQDLISNAKKVSFSFSGKGKVYKFDFCLIGDGNGNEYPWAPIIEIEKTLYQETSAYPHLRNEWTTNGRILDLLASTAIKSEYRMIGPNNEPWVRCAGVVTILCKKDGPACEAFRDQLGEWLESKVASGIDGGEPPAFKSTGNALADHAFQIGELSKIAGQAILDAEKAQKIAENADRKADSLIRRLDEMTGGDFYMTARLACLKCGVDPNAAFKGKQTNAMALGAWCSDQVRKRGLSTAPKITEGTFIVNQFSRDLLREGCFQFGFINRSHH
jgi:hypothetical protein